ncbi:succinate dehydrogenase, iron sulfur protein [Legionella sainthelensi]|uniref:succinate dehydrogenase n=1 Tax=Legionella sainthelensi TaxID=28087 RepID=A0A0W0YD47_9GAMM|nr:2Fe-2S iron-sulfur cluster-binding protein [Legionella sainthelensi]KTD54548.1 succinate dehydrogenase, iron sulfur protein [Legionella sainthelensi]VEH28589.1 succinate dehydrogenase, iron sulfur protein [Legionella sainthelensi]
MHFSINRYHPATDTKLYLKDYDLDMRIDFSMMVLDVLQRIREREGFCASGRKEVDGSDEMSFNGLNCLHITFMLSRVRKPLISFTTIADLVRDFTVFFKQCRPIKSYLQNDFEPLFKERLQTPLRE